VNIGLQAFFPFRYRILANCLAYTFWLCHSLLCSGGSSMMSDEIPESSFPGNPVLSQFCGSSYGRNNPRQGCLSSMSGNPFWKSRCCLQCPLDCFFHTTPGINRTGMCTELNPMKAVGRFLRWTAALGHWSPCILPTLLYRHPVQITCSYPCEEHDTERIPILQCDANSHV